MIYSVGHSNYDMEKFLDIVKAHGIEEIVDVRFRPYSAYVPHFNRDNLERVLKAEGIVYRFAGQFLGNDDSISEEKFNEGIEKVMTYQKGKALALMCSERDFKKCHRFSLISEKILLDKSDEIHHIVSSSEVVLHSETRKKADKTGTQINLL